MRILLHICCANCVIFPFLQLKGKGEEVTGYFFNPNIHPFQEYQKRLETLKVYSGKSSLEVIYRNEYLLEEFLKNVALHPEERSGYCYSVRLEAAAREAKQSRFDSFSTTLLYSIFQKHDLIREMGERIAEEVGHLFHYEDFRRGWREGVKVSKAMGFYRQQYCGCITARRKDL